MVKQAKYQILEYSNKFSIIQIFDANFLKSKKQWNENNLT